MTTEMDMDLTFEHSEEKELLPEEKREVKRDFEGSELRLRSDIIDSAVDEYSYQFNLNLSIAITEEETGEVETEFTDSIKEIEGSKSFPCMHCEKVCKSHQLEAYNEAREYVTVKTNHIPLCEGTIVSTVESIKSDLLEKDYYGEEIQNGLKNIVGVYRSFVGCITIFVCQVLS